ncbi:MAG TPA: vWA domain-containing protein [Patescibacteria group bacterium]|nr:vWA domain-containing protein [Patescibacteria group bacterium]
MSDILNVPQQLTTPSGFQFSGANISDLESTEYTIVTIVVDTSGSVSRFRQELEDCVKTVLQSCEKSPRAENLLVRYVTFDNRVDEVFGFRMLDQVQLSEVDGSVRPGGGTNLFDAAQSAVEATYDYGKLLTDQDYFVNGVVYVITDGGDTGSGCNPAGLKRFIEQQTQDEEGLESMSVILIGVGYGGCAQHLDRFRNEANLTQFMDMEELFNKTSPDTALAKLAGMVSQSISTVSMSLQNGSSSPSSAILTF